MTASLKVITTPKTRAQADVVERLEGMLEHAKAGTLTGVIIVGATVDGSTVTSFSKCLNQHVLISGLEIAKHRVIEGMTSTPINSDDAG